MSWKSRKLGSSRDRTINLPLVRSFSIRNARVASGDLAAIRVEDAVPMSMSAVILNGKLRRLATNLRRRHPFLNWKTSDKHAFSHFSPAFPGLASSAAGHQTRRRDRSTGATKAPEEASSKGLFKQVSSLIEMVPRFVLSNVVTYVQIILNCTNNLDALLYCY